MKSSKQWTSSPPLWTLSSRKTVSLFAIKLKANYWIYHKNVIEDADEEKLNPADKVWLIVKYVNPVANTNMRVNCSSIIICRVTELRLETR